MAMQWLVQGKGIIVFHANQADYFQRAANGIAARGTHHAILSLADIYEDVIF